MTAKTPLEYKQLPVYIETVDEDQGIVTAVPAVMGNVDHQGDRIWQGAFTKTIQERGAKVRILDNHNADSTLDVVGRIVSLREIEKAELPPELLMQYPEAIGGLSADVQFLMDTPEGLGVFKRLKAGAITEWSIGYDAVDKDHERIEVDGEEMVVRNLKQIRLWELSPVIWGANPATMTVSAKAADSTDAETGPSEGKPWRVEQREGEFCVFKLDDEGNLDGEALKCYEDEADAIAYLRALYVNVEDAGDDEMDGDTKAGEDHVTAPELKEGRVLSARNATRIVSALTALIDTLESAGLDVPRYAALCQGRGRRGRETAHPLRRVRDNEIERTR
jgi:HK97 family phage prohead protease